MDEKPHIQVLERAQGWLRLPSGKVLNGFSLGNQRRGTDILFAAMEGCRRPSAGGSLFRTAATRVSNFMSDILVAHRDREVHVIPSFWTISIRTKPKQDRWLALPANVHFRFVSFPTYSSWLNLVEIWFSILRRHALSWLVLGQVVFAFSGPTVDESGGLRMYAAAESADQA